MVVAISKKTEQDPSLTNTMTQVQFAKHRGVTQAAVSAWIGTGRLDSAMRTVFGVGKRKTSKQRIDPNAADEILDENVGLHDAKAKKIHYESLTAELNYQHRLGELVDADEVGKEAFAMARMVRDSILQLPDRISAQLAAEKNETKVYKRLHKELVKCLELLSD